MMSELAPANSWQDIVLRSVIVSCGGSPTVPTVGTYTCTKLDTNLPTTVSWIYVA